MQALLQPSHRSFAKRVNCPSCGASHVTHHPADLECVPCASDRGMYADEERGERNEAAFARWDRS